VPKTGPDEVTFWRVPKFTPEKPPTELFGPTATTAPEAVENEIRPMFPAANPPR
jgi:hypothetical protein